MTLIVEPFCTWHAEVLVVQGVQSSQVQQVSHVPGTYATKVKPPGISATVRDGDEIILCGGILPVADRCGLLWALLSARAGKHMLWLHRATLRFIEIEPMRRLEATVQEGFPEGCRWLELMGFEYEGLMRGYGDNGESHRRYARVRL